MTLEYNTAVTPLSISNVETIKITDIDAGVETLNFVNVTGMTHLQVIGNSVAADVDNMAAIAEISLINTTGGGNFDYAAAAVAGTADSNFKCTIYNCWYIYN